MRAWHFLNHKAFEQLHSLAYLRCLWITESRTRLLWQRTQRLDDSRHALHSSDLCPCVVANVTRYQITFLAVDCDFLGRVDQQHGGGTVCGFHEGQKCRHKRACKQSAGSKNQRCPTEQYATEVERLPTRKGWPLRSSRSLIHLLEEAAGAVVAPVPTNPSWPQSLRRNSAITPELSAVRKAKSTTCMEGSKRVM